jgi:hypothetical protein
VSFVSSIVELICYVFIPASATTVIPRGRALKLAAFNVLEGPDLKLIVYPPNFALNEQPGNSSLCGRKP